jgi:hypothetical protein
MKITGVAVQLLESDTVVNVTLRLAHSEEMEETDVQRIIDNARELAGVDRTADPVAPVRSRSAAPDVSEDAPRRRKAVAEEEGEEKDPTPRRRSRSEDASGAETPTRRGRKTAEPGEEEAAPRRRGRAETSSGDAPSGRRASVNRPDEDAEERPTSRRRSAASEDAEEKPSRSRGRTPTSEGNSRGAEPTKISDEELMKACSATSRVTSSKVVLKIVEQFGVGEVSKITQAERQEFLDLCKEARDAA